MTLPSSGGFEEGFEADAKILTVFEAMKQGQLIDEHGAERKALGADQATRRDRAVDIEDPLELFVEVLDGERAELVEHAADLDTVVGVGIGAATGRDQEAVGVSTGLVERRVLIAGVTEDEP